MTRYPQIFGENLAIRVRTGRGLRADVNSPPCRIWPNSRRATKLPRQVSNFSCYIATNTAYIRRTRCFGGSGGGAVRTFRVRGFSLRTSGDSERKGPLCHSFPAVFLHRLFYFVDPDADCGSPSISTKVGVLARETEFSSPTTGCLQDETARFETI